MNIFRLISQWRHNPKPPKMEGTPKPETPSADWWEGPSHFANRTGVRHKNPLNVKTGSQRWKGQTGKDDRGHAIFDNPAYGVRAAAVLLRTYYNKYGLKTVNDILSRWAPVTDTIGSRLGAAPNSPVEYAAFIRKRTGIAPFERLNLFSNREVDDRNTLAALIKAMAEYEIGAGFELADWVLDEGIDLL